MATAVSPQDHVHMSFIFIFNFFSTLMSAGSVQAYTVPFA